MKSKKMLFTILLCLFAVFAVGGLSACDDNPSPVANAEAFFYGGSGTPATQTKTFFYGSGSTLSLDGILSPTGATAVCGCQDVFVGWSQTQNGDASTVITFPVATNQLVAPIAESSEPTSQNTLSPYYFYAVWESDCDHTLITVSFDFNGGIGDDITSVNPITHGTQNHLSGYTTPSLGHCVQSHFIEKKAVVFDTALDVFRVYEDPTSSADGICIPVRQGFNFVGWSGKDHGGPVLITNASDYADIPSYVTIDVTFYACWEFSEGAENSRVIFVRDYPTSGGSDSYYTLSGYQYVDDVIVDIQQADAQGLITAPNVTGWGDGTVGSFSYRAWSLTRPDESTQVLWNFTTDTVTQPTILYAVYKPGGQAWMATYYKHDPVNEDSGTCIYYNGVGAFDIQNVISSFTAQDGTVYSLNIWKNVNVNAELTSPCGASMNILIVPNAVSCPDAYKYALSDAAAQIPLPIDCTVWKDYNGSLVTTHWIEHFGPNPVYSDIELHGGKRTTTTTIYTGIDHDVGDKDSIGPISNDEAGTYLISLTSTTLNAYIEVYDCTSGNVFIMQLGPVATVGQTVYSTITLVSQHSYCIEYHGGPGALVLIW